MGTAMTARERLEAIADAACPEQETQARIDDYAVEVARTERISTYQAAADLAEDVANELFAAYDTEQGNGAMAVAARLRARADHMEQQ